MKGFLRQCRIAADRGAPVCVPGRMRRHQLAVHVSLIKNRCHEDFAAMTVVPGGRHCDSCRKLVHDLSAMTRDDAQRFVAGRAGESTCYRYLARRDGTLVFAPEPARAALPAVLALGLAACTPWGPPPQQPGSDLPDDVPAVYAEPPVVVIPRVDDERDADDEQVRARSFDDTAPVDPVEVVTPKVRHPRTPVAHPVPPPRPARPAPEYEEFLGGEG